MRKVCVEGCGGLGFVSMVFKLICWLQEVLDYLKSVCGTVHLTRGDFDDIVAPEDKVMMNGVFGH